MRPGVFLLLGFFLLAAPSWGNDDSSEYGKYWPQWRGPEGTGVAPHGDPPIEWSETKKKNVRWTIRLFGEGHASPVVWGDKLFILTAVMKDEEARKEGPYGTSRRRMQRVKPEKTYEFVIMAVHRESGEILWKRTACEERPHEGMHKDGSWASNSPVTDGERVYAYFGSRGLHCFDMEGTPLWKRDFGKMTVAGTFGEGSSPVVYDDTIVVNWDHEGQSFIVAMDKKTGKDLWRKDRDETSSWATPIVVEHEGKPQVVTSGAKRVRGYDLATGKLIWECGGMTPNPIPCPVSKHGMVYVMSGSRGSALLAIRLDRAKKDITGSEAIAWEYDKYTPYVSSPLFYGDSLYFLQVNGNLLSCFDARKGEPNYTRRKLEGINGVYASPVGAGGRVYLVGRNGIMLVIRNGPEYKVLGTNSLNDSFSASPAIVGKCLYLRGFKKLYCIARD